MVHDKVTNEESWIILKGYKKELKYPQLMTQGHEYYIQLHVTEAHTHNGIRLKHKICQPILRKSFTLGTLFRQTSDNCSGTLLVYCSSRVYHVVSQRQNN